MRIQIPKGLHFADLKLELDIAEAGVLPRRMDPVVLHKLATANAAIRRGMSEDMFTLFLIVNWYRASQKAGEPVNIGMEHMMSEDRRRFGGLH